MNDALGPGPDWRADVDLDVVEMVLDGLDPLLRAVAATGASMIIKVDGERTSGIDPKVFTVVISGIGDEGGPIRVDGADLGRAVHRALGEFDHRQ
jgi:hypothetical protein